MIAAGADDEAADLRVALDAAPPGPARARQAFELGVGILIEGPGAQLTR
jgi:hypothetical protein